MSEDQKQPARHAIHNLELYRNREAPWPNGALGVLKAFVDEASASPGPASDAELPPLPESDWVLAGSANNRDAYTADQMRAYGQACARAASTRTASDTRTAALQEAAKACEGEQVENTGHEGDRCYNMAIKDCAKAIRALAQAAGEAECDAALGRAAPAVQHDAFPAILFDTQAVYDEAKRKRPHGSNPTPTQVADTLDAVVRLIRREARLDALTRSRAEGGNTQPVSVESARPAGVDVEAERKLFEVWAKSAQFDLRRPHKTYHNTCTSYAWQGWLAARTQADAGKEREQVIEPPRYSYGPDGKGPVTFLNPMSPREFADRWPQAWAQLTTKPENP